MLAIYYLLTRVPRPFRILAAIMLAGLLIMTVAQTIRTIHYVHERNSHVHTRRSPR